MNVIITAKAPTTRSQLFIDVAPVTPGVAVDLSHIPTDADVKGYAKDDLPQALAQVDKVHLNGGCA